MESTDLALAGDLATLFTVVERSSEWYPSWGSGARCGIADLRLSLPKLRHDVDQFRHLRAIGILNADFDGIMHAYDRAIEKFASLGTSGRTPLGPEEVRTVGRAYGRIVHLASAPRLPTALSPTWNRKNVERSYLMGRPEVVIVDNFLTEEALASLQGFCVESTIWSGNRYAHGRLGALFFTGFNCPLLLQIAEEVRDAFPSLIRAEHPLRQLWAFKNTSVLPADTTIHADFAAVNVNFWLTPDVANLKSEAGGMVIYDLEAPLSWGFNDYNQRSDLIRKFVAEHRPRSIRVPYRQNRAIIFNSDLFHATEAVHFSPEYASHRINVTMLYGDRLYDGCHQEPRRFTDRSAGVLSPAWRSAAFTRTRP